jgi:TetR/AcrR family transcriptional regulator, cholesterol catabolism regulator
MTKSPARERMLDAAERLFAERGYTAVTLTDIAQALGIKHASLYHHVPAGKEALYIEVTERQLARHRAGMDEVVAQHAGDLRAPLVAIADWILTHPPMDIIRMMHSDMPHIEPQQAHRLSQLALEAAIEPIADVLGAAKQRGDIDHDDVGLVAGGFFGMINSLHAVPETSLVQPRVDMATTLIDVLLRGLLKR